MDRDKHFVLGVYDDEDVLLSAVEKVRKSGVKIQEVYSPFPVHLALSLPRRHFSSAPFHVSSLPL